MDKLERIEIALTAAIKYIELARQNSPEDINYIKGCISLENGLRRSKGIINDPDYGKSGEWCMRGEEIPND